MSIFNFSYEFPSTIQELDNFNGKEFEVFLFRFFNALGHEARLTDDSNDKGIDLIVGLNENGRIKRIGVQAKRWKSKVGATEIRAMLDGQKHYSLDEVWIVTTSDLTSAAVTTAMNNKIEIINRDRVINFLEELKKLDNIRFKELPKTKNENSVTKKSIHLGNPLFETLKDLRHELAKTHKLFPVYLVYNNNTIDELIEKKPRTIEKLLEIKGITKQKSELFGIDIINTINEFYSRDTSIIKTELLEIRKKIANYNKFESEESALSDKAIEELSEKLPDTKEELEKIAEISELKIKMFGNYLLKAIKSLKEKHNN